MRGYNFFTSIELDANDCLQELKNVIKNVKMNGDNDIWVDDKHRSFLWISNGDFSDFVFTSEEEAAEFKSRIPIESPYVNDFETHRSIDLKRFITALVRIYPELYIYSDEDDMIGSAQEFLDKEFDY
ncbi:MAG: hypothetical protein J6D09_02880 [Clostridia bacterium]|nr:hypothetical protein [Clostridia bacterium]